MAETRVLSLADISEFFLEDHNCIRRGENSLSSNNVIEPVIFDGELRILKGKVRPSMRKTLYNVSIFLTTDYSIQSATCDCPRGEFLCHHMAAIALYAHYNLSRTDIACPWTLATTSSTTENSSVKAVLPEQMFNPGVTVTQNAIATLRADLREIDHNKGLLWLMSAEPSEEIAIIPFVEDVLQSEDYLNAQDKRLFLEDKLSLSDEQIVEVATKTINQANNPLWLILRKHRLTASNFGAILRAHEINSFPPSLFKKLAGVYNLEGVKQIQYGRRTEKIALAAFEEKNNVKIQPAGLWLHSCGYLGASPDGFIDSDGLIEIKCPYKYRDSSLEEVLNDKDILHFNDGHWILNTEHAYYHQIQGQLHMTNRKYCKLIIYTNLSMVVETIFKSTDWSANIDVLRNFYFEHYIPYIWQN